MVSNSALSNWKVQISSEKTYAGLAEGKKAKARKLKMVRKQIRVIFNADLFHSVLGRTTRMPCPQLYN